MNVSLPTPRPEANPYVIMPKILTFHQALDQAPTSGKKHLLLGNGFSISCRPDIFRYGKLFEQADFANLSPNAKEAFERLGTMDFEHVIRVLRDGAALADLYGAGKEVTANMSSDADALKEVLVKTIAASHPEKPSDITDAEYDACKSFLNNFDDVYSFNYDLLVYWAKMHTEGHLTATSDDGFRTSQNDIDSGIESDYVVWESSQSHDQNLYYLHGALHIFDSGTEIRKYTWKRTGIRLIDQIRAALVNDFFPLFVAEGSSDEKLERIRHSDYLAKAYRSFESIQGTVFIYGHSLAENDEHYLRLLENGKVSTLFVGLFGDASNASNKRIIARAEAMAFKRGGKRPLAVHFFQSETAKVWGK